MSFSSRALPLVLLLSLPLVATQALAAKSCDELKTEIAAKLDAKGVKGYTLDVVAKDAAPADAKLIGSCEGGSKAIAYKKS